jgi:predicted RNA-binding Zn ribbon-like protein
VQQGNFQEREVDLAVDLVNTWDVLDDEPEFLRDLSHLRRFLLDHGLKHEAEVATEHDLARLRALRRRVRSIFEAESEVEAVETLNGLLADAIPQLRSAQGRWVFSFEARRERDLADRLGPRVAAALLEAIRAHGWERFGICDALPCRCVFVDRSRNRSRRYCSQLCADRVAAAAYRRRQTASSEADSSSGVA